MLFGRDMENVFDFDSKEFKHRRSLPTFSGIYFVVIGREVVYIGQSENIRQRWNAHNMVSFLREIEDAVSIYWTPAPTDLRSRLEIERDWIRKYLPRYNRLGKEIEDDIEIYTFDDFVEAQRLLFNANLSTVLVRYGGILVRSSFIVIGISGIAMLFKFISVENWIMVVVISMILFVPGLMAIKKAYEILMD